MQYVGKALVSVSNTWNSLNPATLGGAVDVIVVEHANGDLCCSPFHVRFGKFSLLQPFEKRVEISVNGVKVDIPMKLGEDGEAHFVFEDTDFLPQDKDNVNLNTTGYKATEDQREIYESDRIVRDIPHEEFGERSKVYDLFIPDYVDILSSNEGIVSSTMRPKSPTSSPLSTTVKELPIRKKNYIKTLRLTSAQLRLLHLHSGCNTLTFQVRSNSSIATCHAHIYLWSSSTPVVISDIDGTITKSDALGHMLTLLGRDWTHKGVAKLFTDIANNGYNILYLTSRSVGQSDKTRGYLRGIKQDEDGYELPEGPVILSPDRTFAALKREVVLQRPDVFKTACLGDIRELYSERNKQSELCELDKFSESHGRDECGQINEFSYFGGFSEFGKPSYSRQSSEYSGLSKFSFSSETRLSDKSGDLHEVDSHNKVFSHNYNLPSGFSENHNNGYKFPQSRSLDNLTKGYSIAKDGNHNINNDYDLPSLHFPFYAGFGNRITDALSYRSVGIPSSRIFTINYYGDVHMEFLELAGVKSSYVYITDLVDHFFPPVGHGMGGENGGFTDTTFWRIPVGELSGLDSDLESNLSVSELEDSYDSYNSDYDYSSDDDYNSSNDYNSDDSYSSSGLELEFLGLELNEPGNRSDEGNPTNHDYNENYDYNSCDNSNSDGFEFKLRLKEAGNRNNSENYYSDDNSNSEESSLNEPGDRKDHPNYTYDKGYNEDNIELYPLNNIHLDYEAVSPTRLGTFTRLATPSRMNTPNHSNMPTRLGTPTGLTTPIRPLSHLSQLSQLSGRRQRKIQGVDTEYIRVDSPSCG